MSQAKQNILSRLKRAKPIEHSADTDTCMLQPTQFEHADKVHLLIDKLQENHVEVHRVTADTWQNTFLEVVDREQAYQCLLGQGLDYHESLPSLSSRNSQLRFTPYDQPYEALRETLFHDIDISITLAQGAIAETGTVVLIPDANEPRMLSLIAPIHVVRLKEEQIVGSLSELIENSAWESKEAMPSNILFISSPSKTADIQQTLAYGAHGPKKLIVLLEVKP